MPIEEVENILYIRQQYDRQPITLQCVICGNLTSTFVVCSKCYKIAKTIPLSDKERSIYIDKIRNMIKSGVVLVSENHPVSIILTV